MKPVAWMETYCGEPNNLVWSKEEAETIHPYNAIPLYNAPKELSDEEIIEIGNAVVNLIDSNEGWIEFAKAILKKASEK